MVKRERYTATHMDTDSAPDKRDKTSCYKAYNLEVTHNGRNLSISPTKTKGLFINTNLEILVGDVVIDGVLYLFEHKTSGVYPDTIYNVTTEKVITAIVSSNFGWDENTQLDVVGNRENENIIKVYWADGINQLRTINVVRELPDILPYPDGTVADIVLPVSLSKPTTTILQGGNLIAGKVQYAYSLFNLHGVETVVSNLSTPLSISYDMEGGESAEVMSLSAEVYLNSIDTAFEYIRIYSIHYQEANQVPKITLIYETKITGSTLTLVDDGNLFISELSYEQFVFLGGVLVIPATIASKDNRLFAANYKTTNFDIPDTHPLNSRVFGFASVLATPPAEAWSVQDQIPYQFLNANVRRETVTYSAENWTNEISNPVLPVIVTNNDPIINPLESYTEVYSDTTYAGILYDSAIGSNLGLAVSVTTAVNSTGGGEAGKVTTDQAVETGAAFGAVGYYRVSWQLDVVRTTAGSETVTPILRIHTLDGTTEDVLLLATNGGGGVPYSTDQSFSATFDVEIGSTFDGLRVTVISDSDEWTIAGVMSTMYRYSTIYKLFNVPINDPVDAGIWKDYDITAIQFEDAAAMNIDGTSCTPNSIAFSASTKLATFTFNSAVGTLALGFPYGGDVYVKTSGTAPDGGRVHITDKTDVIITADLTSLPSAYKTYIVQTATASGNADFVMESYATHIISGSSFNPGTEVLTITCADIPLSNSAPEATYVNGLTIQNFATSGTKTPLDAVHIYTDITLTPPTFSGYQSSTITAAVASVNASFPTILIDDYTYGIDSSSFNNSTDVLTLDFGVHVAAGTIPAGSYTGGVQVSSFSWSGMRTPDDVLSAELKVKTVGGTETVYPTPADVPLEHDSINPDYKAYKFQDDVITVGYEGTNFTLYFITTNLTSKRYLKQGEVYRIGVVYYNEYMQRTPTKWMCDIKIPYYTPNVGVYISVAFKADNEQLFIDAGVSSYQIVIVKREPKDRTVSSPGFIVPGVDYIWQNSSQSATGSLHPYYTLKRIIDNSSGLEGGDIKLDYTNGIDFHPISSGVFNAAIPNKDDTVMFFYSSDTAFIIDSLYPPTAIKILGSAKVATNTVPSTQGETKITVKQDGGVYSSGVVEQLFYYDLSTIALHMPTSLLRIANVDSPSGVVQFEHILQHKYTSIIPPGDVYADINLVDSVILKEGSSANLDNTKIANSIQIQAIVSLSEGDDRVVNYAASFAASVALKFSSASWHVDGDLIAEWSKFAYNFTNAAYLPLLELLREVPNQYGGAAYEDKQRNSYMLNGEVVSITSNLPSAHFIGDVYLGPLNINRSDGLNTFKYNYWNIYDYVYIPTLEHNVDIHSRNDDMYKWSLGLDVQTSYELYRLEDNHKLLGAYNQQNDLILGIAKPATFSEVETFNASIIASKQKFPNEVIDSWTDFLINDTMDLDGIYGDIIKLYNFTNEITAYQSKAVAGIMINPRVQLQADDGIGVELGTGTVLYNYKYLTTKSGVSQLWAVTDDSAAMYYYDEVSQSINIHTGEELSTVKKIRTLIREITPGIAIRAVYDIGKQDVIFTFEDKSLVYNKYIGEFVRTEDTHNYIHVFNNKVFSIVSNDLYEHYLGSLYNPLHITYMFAPMPTYEKVFHNIEYRKVGDNNFNFIEAEDTIGRKGEMLNPSIYNKFNINRIHIPRYDNGLERFRDVNILLTLQSAQSIDSMFIDDMVLMYNIKG